MKIGDAGEAFFVFETAEYIPDDLVTSPLLSPTPEPVERFDFEGGRFGAKQGADVRQIDLSSKMQEPEFLDLNAPSGLRQPIPVRIGAKPKLDSRSAPHTPPPEEPLAKPVDVHAPEVQYKAGALVLYHFFSDSQTGAADIALDMAGYHSSQALHTPQHIMTSDSASPPDTSSSQISRESL